MTFVHSVGAARFETTAQKAEPHYEVLRPSVGSYQLGEVLPESLLGPEIERLLHIGAIRLVETDAPATVATETGTEAGTETAAEAGTEEEANAA